jgi:hypothetical protein
MNLDSVVPAAVLGEIRREGGITTAESADLWGSTRFPLFRNLLYRGR